MTGENVIVKNESIVEDAPLFRAPCNITKNNMIEYDYLNNKLYCIRYNCGKIKWKCKNYKKVRK